MDVVFEFLSLLLAVHVYGTDERPRHPFRRNALRAFALGGGIVALLGLFGMFDQAAFPRWLVIAWGFSFVTVLLAEYDMGDPVCAVVASLLALALLSVLTAGWLF